MENNQMNMEAAPELSVDDRVAKLEDVVNNLQQNMMAMQKAFINLSKIIGTMNEPAGTGIIDLSGKRMMQ
jgi:hypothetical protein